MGERKKKKKKKKRGKRAQSDLQQSAQQKDGIRSAKYKTPSVVSS